MRKQIKWVRHLGVLLLTVIIFSLGILIGTNVESQRVQSIYTQLQEQDLEYQRSVTESYYIDYLVSQKEQGINVSCGVLEGGYFTSIQNLEDSRVRLENYINTATSNEEEFQRLKEHYVNIQVNYFILAEKIKDLCGSQYKPILYFYGDEKECPECEDQGVHLSYVKSKLEEKALVFSFDINFEGPTKIISQNYQTQGTATPIVIIEDEIHNYITNEEIFEVLCDNGLEDEVCLG